MYLLIDLLAQGFAVRADENEKEEAERGKKAEVQAVAWFARWFAKPPPRI